MSRQRCGAKTPNGPCKAYPLKGRTRCRNHGGASPVGVAHPNFKHGRYSKAVPRHLASLYDAARNDPDLLALNEEIALVDTRLQATLARATTGEAGKVWQQLGETWRAFLKARARGEVAEMEGLLMDIGTLIGKGGNEAAAWSEVMDLIERRRRLTESEGKRRVQMQQMVTVDRMDALMAQVVDVLRSEVTDTGTLRRISHRLKAVVGGEA